MVHMVDDEAGIIYPALIRDEYGDVVKIIDHPCTSARLLGDVALKSAGDLTLDRASFMAGCWGAGVLGSAPIAGPSPTYLAHTSPLTPALKRSTLTALCTQESAPVPP